MNTSLRSTGRALWVAVKAMAVFTVVLGVAYTAAITLVGQLVLPGQANGSELHDAEGRNVGSALVGQSFSTEDGEPLAEYFQPRPSAAGDGYDAANSYGSNYGPENEDLITAIEERRQQIAETDGVEVSEIPADAVTASGSGLDPHISPEYAAIQVDRVAEARGIATDDVRELVRRYTTGRDLGYLGEPTVNVVQLNLALDESR